VTEPVGDGQEFRDIYARLAGLVTEQAGQRKLRPPPLRDPSVAHVSVLDVPRETLLAIEDDRAFVASCYLVLLDVAPSTRQLQARRRWLRDGTRTRAEILDQIVESRTFANTGRRVHFT
jgi:hypothetical protein